MRHIKLLLFAEGSASVTLQFLFLRQLTPQAGSSVPVTSIVVTVFLLFLALGYRAGGAVREDHLRRLSQNMLMSAALLCAGLSPAAPPLFFAMASALDIHLAAALYTLIFMAPPVYLLGQTMPLLANGVQEEGKGKVSSTVLFHNTLGNVAGGLFLMLVVLPAFGMAAAVLTNIAVLLALFVTTVPRGARGRGVAAAGVVGFIALMTVWAAERTMYDLTTEHANYRVLRDAETSAGRGREFVSNDLIQGRVFDGGAQTGYIAALRRHIAELPEQPADILVLGAGGFTVGHTDRVNRYTYVDIDSQVRAFAERHFLEEPVNGEFAVSDARQYLLRSQSRWDVVVLDAFSAGFGIPEHLSTVEFFRLVRERTTEGGLVMVNAVTRPMFADEYAKRLNRTIQSVFPYCLIEPVSSDRGVRYRSGEYSNHLYVCVNTVNGKDAYTDRRSRLQ